MAASLNHGRSATRPASSGVPDKVNILLVDDQPARLMTYQSVLSELNQNLVCVSSGLEALDKLMRDEYAVVLLDVSMPGMDGFEAARLIHEHPRFERTPIIFVTGVHMSELDRLRGYKLGAVDYVSVPVVPEILRSKVAVLVELYCKRRELVDLNRNLADANEQLAQANAALQAEKTRELHALNESLQEANRNLEKTNAALQGEVAERTRAEQALKEADRHKDEFLAMLAHELRNPLAPIRNAVHLMKMKAFEDPQLKLSRDIIERQLIQLSRLVDDLLDVSRITRGKINLARRRVELHELVARAVETVNPVIESRGHTLDIELPKRTLAIYGDPMRLTQALGNVLGNAAKYTDGGGRIALRAQRRHRDVEISVRDTGIGISPEVLPCIFDLFTQVDQRSGRPQGGLGIGLALVRQLVEMHGGSVTAASEGPGKGSEFVIRLPVSIERLAEAETVTGADGSAAAQADKAAAPAQPPQRRILVADDNQDARESLATLLSLSGHEVFRAQDGSDALQCAERHRPDVALLDIGMPLANGYEVARSIRSQPWGRDMVLVALTGWGQESDRRRSHEAGFNSHLTKPVDPEVLDELLARVT
ncbi:MAG TPA: response regulator [Steroidobacteraceae bacterium]|jgi:signal transduction histidine kinase|nr:response regulator [Steroidobacteraceae bacterium]